MVNQMSCFSEAYWLHNTEFSKLSIKSWGEDYDTYAFVTWCCVY